MSARGPRDRLRAAARRGLLLVAIAWGTQAAATDAPRQGIVPQGFWVLNPARSHSLDPGRQTLWIVKDDGKHLVWVSVMIDDRHRAAIVSYDGAYGGPAAPVVGAPMTTRIEARGPRGLYNEGVMTGLGPYRETCTVDSAGKRFRCEGRVETAQGERTYVDDFDWIGDSPPAARP